MKWPNGELTPFLFKSDYSWQEIGAIFFAMDKLDVGMFVETGINRGDLCSIMLVKSYYDDAFEYIGFTSDIELISHKERLSKFVEWSSNSWVHTGLLSASPRHRLLISNRIKHSPKPAMVFCNSSSYKADFEFAVSCLRCGDVIGTIFREPSEKDRFIVKYVRSGKLEKFTCEMISQEMFIGVIT